MADREWALPAFGARVKEHARRLGLARFWEWWTHELNALMPTAPRAALTRRRMRPVLVFSGESATLWRPATANGQPVMAVATTISLTGDAASVTAAGRAALAPLIHVVYGAPAAAVRVVISLPARDILRRNIVLPSAVEENFRQALGYDLDRHTPFKAEELYFDAAIVDRDAVRNTIIVDLAAARRAVVDPALKAAAAWGADVAAVVPEPPERAAYSRLNLLPAEARTSSSAWTRWQFWVPVALIAVATLAAVVIPLWQKREYVMQLTTLADEARRRAAVSETLRSELDARVSDYNAALERKYAFPSALQVVNAVSKLLPDDTWLTQFELKTMAKGKETQRELLVRGETANAGHLVALFEDSQLFAQAAPRSQTTKIQPGPGEIFDLGAQLKTRALPEPMKLAVTTAPAEAPPPGAPAQPIPAAPPPGSPPPADAPAPPPGAPPSPSGSTATPPPKAPTLGPAAATGRVPPNADMRGRPPEAAMQPPAGTLSPGVAPPADPAKATGNGGGRKP